MMKNFYSVTKDDIIASVDELKKDFKVIWSRLTLVITFLGGDYVGCGNYLTDFFLGESR